MKIRVSLVQFHPGHHPPTLGCATVRPDIRSTERSALREWIDHRKLVIDHLSVLEVFRVKRLASTDDPILLFRSPSYALSFTQANTEFVAWQAGHSPRCGLWRTKYQGRSRAPEY